MSRRAKSRPRGGRRETAGKWERWQFLATVTRVVIEVLEPLIDRYLGGGGPGRLL